jgi:HD-GYP domain-containing protein (c-di-GMP phosphodiesterase class II)
MLKRISVEQLSMGMYIHEFCGSWMEHPFWRSRFLIKDPADLRRVKESSIQEIWIDTAKGRDVPEDVPALSEDESDSLAEKTFVAAEEETVSTVAPVQQVPASEEFSRAAEICARSHTAVVSMFQEARMGKAVDAEQAQSLVEEISQSVTRNPSALISLARLKTADDYTYMHSVAVCALMVALSRQMGLSEEDTRQAGLAGLLHDLGKALMPMEVLNKPGKLTDEEFAIIKRHPEEGHKLLLKAPDIHPISLDVCLHHHEKTDGSGYPEKLKDHQISIYAKMGAVCDVYDAITSNRPYKQGWDPAESLKRMAEWAKGHFDQKVFHAFVKSLGIYPIGSLVLLSSGRLGLVVEQSAGSLLMPHVKVFFCTLTQARFTPEIMDLSAQGCTEKITQREDPSKWNFPDINELWSGYSHAIQ